MIHYTAKGSGRPVVLIHGFPLNSEVWDDFADRLSLTCRVYTPDLPGFGQSPPLEMPFSINDVATEIIQWIEEVKLEHPIIIGHSLGGYVALAIAHLRPQLPLKIGLFHSTAYPDSEEKKQNRNKVIDFISKNGVLAFTSNFTSTLFANPEHPSVPYVREISMKAPKEAVVGYTQAMRDRDSRLDLMKDFPRAVLIITGENDGGISVESVEKQAEFARYPEVHVLKGIAHMGMFENPDLTGKIIQDFIAKK
jgi:pimeloyl-ACP methyl ester carboxylesterase